MPSLLFVNMHYAPDIAATGQHLSDLAEYLAGLGYDVKVLCGQGRYVQGQVDAPKREVRNSVAVHRIRTLSIGRHTHSLRVLNYAVFYLQVMFLVLAGPRRRHVVFLTTPPLLAFIGFLAWRVRGIRYAVWSMDLHPDAEVAAGMLDENGFGFRILYRLNARAYRHADLVVDLGKFMKTRIEAYGVPRDRLRTVNIWSASDSIWPVPRKENPLVEELSLGQKVVVGYSGNAGIAHRFEEVLAAIAQMRDDEILHFLFIGNGPRRLEIEAFVAERRITNFDYLDYFPRDILDCSLSLVDIHLVTLRKEFAGIAVPAKVYGIMASSRPVIFVGPTACETAETILTARCGIVIDPYVDPNPTQTLVQTIEAWRDDPSLRSDLGTRGRRAYLEDYQRRDCCDAFETLIRDWVAKH